MFIFVVLVILLVFAVDVVFMSYRIYKSKGHIAPTAEDIEIRIKEFMAQTKTTEDGAKRFLKVKNA